VKILVEVECYDYFVFNGKLADCPDWVVDSVEDGDTSLKHSTLYLKGDNGYTVAPTGSVVIRREGPFGYNYAAIRGELING
jgi:hypothetical protein